MTRFGLWIFMSKITHDFWLCYTIFLDNEKAFDRVWQDGLLYKLNQIWIQGTLWNLIYFSYKTATAHVQYNGLTGQVFRIEQGASQNCVLSAWLFSLFINDLIYELLSTKSGLLVGPISIPAILLADDTTLLSSSVNTERVLLPFYTKNKSGSNVFLEFRFDWAYIKGHLAIHDQMLSHYQEKWYNIARNHGWFCSWIFINQIASCMTSANKRWTIFGKRWWKLASIFFLINISSQFWSHK
jgi:hypothetical protein